MKARTQVLAAIVSAVVVVAVLGAERLTAAFSDTRTISFYHIHTQETLTVTYKKDGRFVPEALEKINWIMRDWRRNQQTTMDPNTIDILWEMHTELGSKEPINIICGYRSRETNEMLRRTVGGQASESQHITGKAVDVTFPDVPLKQIRYAALIRERGGVGYYPTSGIPFVHVDTGNVRHWPRLPRYELALLFPNGHSRHHPVDGGDLTPADVSVAQSHHKELAQQIAAFFTLRSAPKEAVMVASAEPTVTAAPAGLSGTAAHEPLPSKPWQGQVASLGAVGVPKLVSEPKVVERPSRLSPAVSERDRKQLSTLVTLAQHDGLPKLISGPVPVHRAEAAEPMPRPVTGETPQIKLSYDPSDAPRTSWTRLAALAPDTTRPGAAPAVLSDADRAGWGTGYASAPQFDDEHPEELSYRPFPIGPLLTTTASINEPALSRVTQPDLVKVLQVLDSPSIAPPMSFRPGQQTAQVMWAQQFSGQPVEITADDGQGGTEDVPTRLIPRGVKTVSQDQ